MQVERTFNRVNRRNDVRMSAEEIDEFLRRGPNVMALATINADGSIHLVTVAFAYLDGSIWTKSKPRAQKVINLRRHPFASCLMSDGDDDYEAMRGLSAAGRVSIAEDDATVIEVTRAITFRFEERASGGAPDERRVQRLAQGYVAMRFDDPKFVTWDHRKLTQGQGF